MKKLVLISGKYLRKIPYIRCGLSGNKLILFFLINPSNKRPNEVPYFCELSTKLIYGLETLISSRCVSQRVRAKYTTVSSDSSWSENVKELDYNDQLLHPYLLARLSLRRKDISLEDNLLSNRIESWDELHDTIHKTEFFIFQVNDHLTNGLTCEHHLKWI